MSAGAVIGREEELGEVRACVTACADGPAALTLAGEPGIGKTVLWEAGVEDARERGYRVLVHRSVEAEAGFAFAGLSDLVGPVFEEVAGELAAPRRRALEVALLLADADDAPWEPHAIGLALLDVLRVLAHEAPVLVALDDLQWLDASSASVLPVALRRLEDERVGLLATLRTGGAGLRAWESTRLGVLPLEPIGLAAVHDLVRERLGLELARPRLTRVHETSGGNPFFALELARAPDGSVPQSLRDLLGGRIAALPAQTTEVLLLAAALARPTEALVCAAHGDPDAARTALAGAADVIVDENGRLLFAHPLLASLCYQRAIPSRRRDAHRRLADVVTDREERARHLALAVTEPDAEVADQLDAASARAAARGAAIAAAELAELAAERTPPTELVLHRRRRLGARRLLWLAGDLQRASAIAEELLSSTPPGPERADLLYVLAVSGGQPIATRIALCEQGIAEAGDDDAHTIELFAQLAVYRWFSGQMPAALAAAREGLRRAERIGDRRLLVIAQMGVARIETRALQITPGLLEQALATEATLDPPLPFFQSPRETLAVRFVCNGAPADGRAILEDYLRTVGEGAEFTYAFAYIHLVVAEWQLGRWDAARSYARAARSFAAQAHDPSYRGISGFLSALVEADRGFLDEAREYAESGLANAASIGDEVAIIANQGQLGHIELVAGEPEAAARHLRHLPERLLRNGQHHGVSDLTWPDAIEALIAVADLDEAGIRIAQYADIAALAGGSHAIALRRVRGMLAAAHGDTQGALAALGDAVTTEATRVFPFERARSMLALGTVQRQARERRAARETLQQAIAAFDDLGAAPWTLRARDELRRVSGRRGSHDELTDAERRVAALAASGHRNKEIAARLVVEVSTVEAHLSRVYSKLGVRSRTELATRIAATQDAPSIL
jgi:DNA-binding CsgD family transcriptional regulator